MARTETNVYFHACEDSEGVVHEYKISYQIEEPEDSSDTAFVIIKYVEENGEDVILEDTALEEIAQHCYEDYYGEEWEYAQNEDEEL